MNCIVTHISGMSLCTLTTDDCITDGSVSLNFRGPFRGGEAIFTSADDHDFRTETSAESAGPGSRV
jgi:hypothetical protein